VRLTLDEATELTKPFRAALARLPEAAWPGWEAELLAIDYLATVEVDAAGTRRVRPSQALRWLVERMQAEREGRTPSWHAVTSGGAA